MTTASFVMSSLASKAGEKAEFIGIAALAVSLLALMVSAAALGWQVLNYLLTGQRVKVVVTGMNLYAPGSGTKLEPMVQITVSAIGRVPVEVTGWALSYPAPGNELLHSTLVKLQYGAMPTIYLGDELPKVIEPGRSGSFNLPTVAVTKMRDESGLDPMDGHLSIYFAARRSKRLRKPIGELVRLP